MPFPHPIRTVIIYGSKRALINFDVVDESRVIIDTAVGSDRAGVSDNARVAVDDDSAKVVEKGSSGSDFEVA